MPSRILEFELPGFRLMFNFLVQKKWIFVFSLGKTSEPSWKLKKKNLTYEKQITISFLSFSPRASFFLFSPYKFRSQKVNLKTVWCVQSAGANSTSACRDKEEGAIGCLRWRLSLTTAFIRRFFRILQTRLNSLPGVEKSPPRHQRISTRNQVLIQVAINNASYLSMSSEVSL